MLQALILLPMAAGQQKVFDMNKIGFMQGRLSKQINGKIQAFPVTEWREEFFTANKLGFSLMEWTLDSDLLDKNPLMTEKGRQEIKELSSEFDLSIESVTGDCFMQKPFYKNSGSFRQDYIYDFFNVVNSCALLKIKLIVIPLVDNGSIENEYQEDSLFDAIYNIADILKSEKINLAFESDLDPLKLKKFIDRYDNTIAGINYDIGNSASSGFDPLDEFFHYGHRIINVHVKDRLYNGTTVPLGEGNANFSLVFNKLKDYKYNGNYILQTARCPFGMHSDVLIKYKNMVLIDYQ